MKAMRNALLMLNLKTTRVAEKKTRKEKKSRVETKAKTKMDEQSRSDRRV